MKHSLTIWLAATRMVTLRYQLEVSSKTAPSLDVNFGRIRRFRVDGGLPFRLLILRLGLCGPDRYVAASQLHRCDSSLIVPT